MVRVKLPDGSDRTFDGDEVPVSDVVASFGEGWQRNTVGIVYNGDLKDVHQSISGEGDLRLLRDSDAESLYILRHSASHVMAHAVQELFPGARFAIGPPIENGRSATA